jgi:hypothetical protein
MECKYQHEHQHTSEFSHDKSPKQKKQKKIAGSGIGHKLGSAGNRLGGGSTSPSKRPAKTTSRLLGRSSSSSSGSSRYGSGGGSSNITHISNGDDADMAAALRLSMEDTQPKGRAEAIQEIDLTSPRLDSATTTSSIGSGGGRGSPSGGLSPRTAAAIAQATGEMGSEFGGGGGGGGGYGGGAGWGGHHDYPQRSGRNRAASRSQVAASRVQHQKIAEDRSVMNEQDGEYYESLIADKEKEEKKRQEEREAREQEELDKILAASQTTAAEDEKRREEEAERMRLAKKHLLPAEPTPIKRSEGAVGAGGTRGVIGSDIGGAIGGARGVSGMRQPLLPGPAPALRSGSDGSDGGGGRVRKAENSSSSSSSSSTSSSSSSSMAREGAPATDSTSSTTASVITLSFRLPRACTVKRLERRFRTTDTLQLVFDYLDCDDSVASINSWDMFEPYPRNVFDRGADKDKTLHTLGLTKSALLVIQDNDA